MSSSDTGPRSGSKKPKSAEEMSDQLDESRSQMKNLASSVTDAAGKQITSAQGQSLRQRSGTISSRRSASRRVSVFYTR